MTTTPYINDDFVIEDGPSREQLFDALRLFNEHRIVTFTLRRRVDTDGSVTIGGQKWDLSAQTLSIMAEDGSGHSWILQVRFKAEVDVLNTAPVQIYYHDTRRGGCVSRERR